MANLLGYRWPERSRRIRARRKENGFIEASGWLNIEKETAPLGATCYTVTVGQQNPYIVDSSKAMFSGMMIYRYDGEQEALEHYYKLYTAMCVVFPDKIM